MGVKIFIVSLWSILLQAAAPADLPVFSAFQQTYAGAKHFVALKRTGVTEELDLVIAMGSATPLSSEQTAWVWWSENRKIALFLQERLHPERVYRLGSEAGFPDCAARIERATATDSVISCQGEKSDRQPNQKWVYDVRTKKLLSQFSYRPFAMHRIFPTVGAAVFVGNDTERLVAVMYKPGRDPVFRVLKEADARPWMEKVHSTVGTEGREARRVLCIPNEKVPPPAKVPSLPRTTYDQFAAARPQRVTNGYKRVGTEIHDSIGPWQKVGAQIWFGKSFYDGEGSTGVGGFGYFDLNERKLQMFTPPEVADWSVSAIDVGPDAAWMGLVHNGEWGGSSGGLLRYDRHSGAMQKLQLPDIANHLTTVNGSVVAATDFGLALIEGERVKRFFVDQTSYGGLRVAAATR